MLSIFLFAPIVVWAGNNIVLLMDNSGSMRKNDPDFWSKSSAEFFVSRCQPTDRVSIIPFDSSLRLNKKQKFVDPLKHRKEIIKFIREMDYKGPWTDFHWALNAAYEELKRQEGKKYVILFTDGEPDPDPKDKQYEQTADKAKKNRELSMEVIRKLYKSAGIRLFTIAFTNKSDIDFLKAASKEANGSYDFCFRVDQSYGISDVFLKISNFIPVIANWFSYGINIPPSLAKSFILVNLNKNISRREYINQNILDTIAELVESSGHKGIPVVPYNWPQLTGINNIKDVVRELSKTQKFFIVLDFQDNAQTAEYHIYDLTNIRKSLHIHKKITLGILSELCGQIAHEIFSNLKDYKVKKEITLPVTVKYLATKEPAVAEVTFIQGDETVVEYTDAFGHAIFVGYEKEPFTISFASGGVKLGTWKQTDYKPDKVFYLAAGYDVALKVQAIDYKYDDLDSKNKGPAPKIEVKARIELEALGKKRNAQTPCVEKNVPLGLAKLTVIKPISVEGKEGNIPIPTDAYLPHTKYINVSPSNLTPENNRLDETIILDKNYLADFKMLLTEGKVLVADEKARRLIFLRKDHPQVFEIVSLISQDYFSQGDFKNALEILAYFHNKYKEKYYYRKSQGLTKDRFLLSLRLAELRLINYLEKPTERQPQGNLAKFLGLADLRNGQHFLNLCQNSMTDDLKIKSLDALEFYLTYALAEFKAHQLTDSKLGKDWSRYYARYKKILKKGKYGIDQVNKLLPTPGLLNLFSEAERTYNPDNS